jgi:TolB-like protein
MRACSLLLLLVLGVGITRSAEAQQNPGQTIDTRPGIAVLPFYDGGSIGPNRENLERWTIGLQQQMITELAQNPTLRLVERGRLREILDELDLARTDRVDPQTAARVGRLVGARYMIVPSYTDVYGTLQMNARIVDAETGEIFPRPAQVQGKREGVFDLVVDLSNRLTQGMRLPPLAANVQAERKARKLPEEAFTLYALALGLQEDGEVDEAIELYRRISQQFPQMTEASEALRQLTDTSE